MPSTKRPSDVQHVHSPATKIQRLESADFSGAVKKKLSGASRTGQACDRCKIRKIRCDARPGGCSPCAQNNHECTTTDRITGRATSRGYTENVETENSALRRYLNDLRQQLQEHGIEPRAQPAFRSSISNDGSSPSPTSATNLNDPHNLARILNPEPLDPNSRSRNTVLPDFQPDNVGDNYLGVASSNDWPSPVGGMQHALFGMHLDLKDFVANDDSEISTATSYESFLTYISTKSTKAPALPPYQQCRSMAEWFFKMSGSWLPILHKPDILNLVDRIYNVAGYNATVAETVQLHLVLAAMLFQYAVRNSTTSEFEWSAHYRYALSFFIDLYRENTLPALQGLAMVVLVQRAFPKPGAVWIVSVNVLAKAVENGLHRSVNAWNTPENQISAHEIEMRKRVFWSILLPHITVGSRLGRPFIIRLEDFDIELPEPVPDFMPGEENLPAYRKCSFSCAISGFKFLVVQLQMYSNLYTIRPNPQPYEQVRKKLSRGIEVWFKSMPPELRNDDQDNPTDRGCKIYMDFAHQNMRILLYHPSLLKKQDPELLSRNLDVCLDASSKLLGIAQEMRTMQILDTTWFNSSYFLAAMFTTLFAYSERKDRISSAELKALRKEMDQWIELMGDVGFLLGSGSRLPNALRQISSAVINDISRHLAAKTASAAFASTNPHSTVPTIAPNQHGDSNSHAAHTHRSADQQQHVTFHIPFQNDPNHSQQYLPQGPQGYNTQQPFYPDPTASNPPYTDGTYPNTYDADMKPDMVSSLAQHASLAAAQQAPQAPFYAYAPSPTMHTGTAAWRTFADTVSPHGWGATNALLNLQQQQQQQSPLGVGDKAGSLTSHAQNGAQAAAAAAAAAAATGLPSVAAHSSGVASTVGGTAGLFAENGQGQGHRDGDGDGHGHGLASGQGAMGPAWQEMGLYAAAP